MLLGRAVLLVCPCQVAGEHPRPAWHLVLVSVLPGIGVFGVCERWVVGEVLGLDISTFS